MDTERNSENIKSCNWSCLYSMAYCCSLFLPICTYSLLASPSLHLQVCSFFSKLLFKSFFFPFHNYQMWMIFFILILCWNGWCCSSIQVFMTVVKYIPQVRIYWSCVYWFSFEERIFIRICKFLWLNEQSSWYIVMWIWKQAIMNFKRKSTDGFSITNILLDLSGAITSYGQMVVQSLDQGSWTNFYGNIGKLMLSLVWKMSHTFWLSLSLIHFFYGLLWTVLNLYLQVTVLFDSFFICQHFVLYPAKKTYGVADFVEPEDDIKKHLLPCSDEPKTADNV